ncbi:MAG: ATP-binding protein [candidate division Zixibacteria bacterium]|nr:ATP-binding protein [candidate division Zixibacteria bacterium]MDD5426137.1 ATP-binding protein [candidate division Zixibacteria bacterium]
MPEKNHDFITESPDLLDDVSRFTESYASFNRIINNLQRQYIKLKEEFTAQNDKLVETNRKLMEVTGLNLAATEFLNSILNSIAIGVIAVDGDGRITHFNPAASMMLGIAAVEPLGKLYRDVIPPGNLVEANASRAVETGRELNAVEKEIILPDNTRLCVSVSTAILRDRDGRPNGAVEVFHDLTKMKKMEQEIARLNTLAALGEMAATIAHEVRNPLAAIGGFAALLKRDMETDDPRQKMVSKIIRGVENLNHTVTSLLNYTRYEEINREAVDYGSFIRQTVEQYKFDNPVSARNNKLIIHTPLTSVTPNLVVVLDPMLYRQMLYNIFTNAIEACNGAGEIKVTYRKLQRHVASKLYAERVVLGPDETIMETIISDNGPGISEDVLERIFTPFFTTKEGGSGLGLAMAWKVIKAHSGEIMADNKTPRGARFTLLLPAKIDSKNMECME